MSLTLGFLLFLVCSLGSTRAEYFLSTIPARVEVGITDGLKLECSFRGDPSSTQLTTISRVRILKEINPDDFEIVAEARDFDSQLANVALGPSVNLTGSVSSVTASYLSVFWNHVTASILGRYRCDVVGFKANQDVYIDRTTVLVLKESNVTVDDLINLIVQQKAELEQQLHDQQAYCEGRLTVIEAGVDQKLQVIKVTQENSTQQFQNQLSLQTAGLEADVRRLMETGVLQYWPQGTYALLTPDTGCPINVGALWEAGIRTFHTESTDRNFDEVSVPSHLQQPTLQRVGINNFLQQHFCVSSTLSPGASWPRGAYCINRVTNVCPAGFNTGAISWQEEITASQAQVVGKLPDGVYTANRTTIYYCCRNDGSQAEPVYLPRSMPFYLYRYNGTCQQVSGMQVSPEYVTFDTDNSNRDAYDNQFHPDGSINNVHIELCYYKQA